jgi:hypothetical protein
VLIEGRDVLGIAATAPARRRRSRCRSSSASSTGAARATARAARARPRADARAVHAGGRGDPQVRPRLRHRACSPSTAARDGQQLRALDRGVDVVVATPGRALDHVNRGTLKLESVRVLVLDEADEMLDMGFEEDLTAIVGATPTERQTALFSATMAPRVARVAGSYLREPARVEVARRQLAEGEMPKVRSLVYLVPRAHKTAALGRVLDMEAPTSAIVFCRTRNEADELTETLAARGFGAEALHGGMGQEARDRVMRRFRGGQLELLVATDVAARGLDVEHVSHVVNYDVPSAPDAYVHRVGRHRRAGREGSRSPSPSRASAGCSQHRARDRQKLVVEPVPTPDPSCARDRSRSARWPPCARCSRRRAASPRAGRRPTRDDAPRRRRLRRVPAAVAPTGAVRPTDFDCFDVTAAALPARARGRVQFVSVDDPRSRTPLADSDRDGVTPAAAAPIGIAPSARPRPRGDRPRRASTAATPIAASRPERAIAPRGRRSSLRRRHLAPLRDRRAPPACSPQTT